MSFFLGFPAQCTILHTVSEGTLIDSKLRMELRADVGASQDLWGGSALIYILKTRVTGVCLCLPSSGALTRKDISDLGNTEHTAATVVRLSPPKRRLCSSTAILNSKRDREPTQITLSMTAPTTNNGWKGRCVTFRWGNI